MFFYEKWVSLAKPQLRRPLITFGYTQTVPAEREFANRQVWGKHKTRNEYPNRIQSETK